MIIYFDEFKIRHLLGATPKALHNRALEEMEQNLIDRSMVLTAEGDGFVSVDISRARREDVISYLADYAACVDVQKGDIQTIVGRNLDALVLIRAFDNFGSEVAARLQSLTVDEIIDACFRVSHEYQNGTEISKEGLQGALYAQAEADLVAAGLLREDEGLGRNLEPPPEPDYIVSRQYREDTHAEELEKFADPFYSTDPRTPAGF